ncbi:hypothetical protein F4802DRAFT_612747 [Xylaria palmicola]|nr:hypothetical protein F4802DRAFT_612747 [Xylaria palmicola]
MGIYNETLGFGIHVGVLVLLLHWRLSRYPRSNIPPSSSTSPPIINHSATKSLTPRSVRLIQVHPPIDNDTETDVDIIAIHGLDTKSPDTWEWKPPGSKETPINWLSHEKMLPYKVPSARIFMCDWPSDLFEHSGYSQKTFEEFAKLLLAGINARPPAPNSTNCKERPILFIASCLGGIILMKALVVASDEYVSVRNAVRGVVFLATPFGGTSFLEVARWAEPGLKALAFIRRQKVSNLLGETKPDIELKRLCGEFVGLGIDPKCMASFYETGKSSLPRKLIPWLPDFLAQLKPLVDESSARLDAIRNPLALDRVHSRMNKFRPPCSHNISCEQHNDHGHYELVASRIHEIFDEIRQGGPLEKADAHINNTCYKDENLKIQRISGAILPMERCYINLVLIEHDTNKLQKVEDSQQSSPFSLQSRLNIETPEKNLQVDLWHLFDERKGDNDEKIKTRKILIRGDAGVGKSTLCKKIVHDFKKLVTWRNMFEYFYNIPDGDKLADALWKNMEADGYGRTLFILDGLDEVNEARAKGHYLFNLVEFLLKLPAAIVTTRPHVSLTDRWELKFDLELKTIGFYPNQVKSYMANVLTMGEDDKPNYQKINGLQVLLQQHQLLQELVRIPIQLDALCYIWNERSGSLHGPALDTMTGIYQLIEEKLWKKDIIRLEKEDGGKTREFTDIQDDCLKTIESYVSAELDFLERLAFTGMRDKKIAFNKSYRAAIAVDGKQPFSPGKALPRLSFLRSPNPSLDDPSYHFLHLTFQEYFAARYFVRQWKDQKPLSRRKDKLSVGNFLADHKYDARYDIFWRFVAGLLSLEDDDEIGRFFGRIKSEPRDLLGPVHQRLVMHCLSEVPPDKASPSLGRKNLEYRLGRWMTFELDHMTKWRLASEMEFPEVVIENLLKGNELKPTTKSNVLSSLRNRPAVSPKIIHLLWPMLQDSKDLFTKIIISKIVTKHQGKLDNEILEFLVADLGGRVSEVVALNILKRWSSHRNDILDAVVTRAMDKESAARQRADLVIGDQSRLAATLIKALMPRVKQERNFPDQLLPQIIDTLAHQAQPNEEVLHFVFARLACAELEIPYREDLKLVAQSLMNHPNLSDIAFSAIKSALTNKDMPIRRAAFGLLGNLSLPQYKAEIQNIVIDQLKGPDSRVRQAVIQALGKWPALDERILDVVTAYSNNENESFDVRYAAAETLEWFAQLERQCMAVQEKAPLESYDAVFEGAVKSRSHKNWRVRERAVEACKGKDIEGIARLLEKPSRERSIVDIQISILKTIKNWPELDDRILSASVKLLISEDTDWIVIDTVCEMLQTRPQPKEGIINSIRVRTPRGCVNPWFGGTPMTRGMRIEYTSFVVAIAILEECASGEELVLLLVEASGVFVFVMTIVFVADPQRLCRSMPGKIARHRARSLI